MDLMLDKINMVRIRGCWKASLCTSPVYASLLLFYHRERRDRGTTKREREREREMQHPKFIFYFVFLVACNC